VGEGFRSDVFWAATWGVGVACGVAAGAWLSAAGSLGAPGAESLDVGRELLTVPLATGCVLMVIYVMVAGILRSTRQRASDGSGISSDSKNRSRANG